MEPACGNVSREDLIAICDLVRDDAVAIGKWSQIIDLIVGSAGDALQIKTLLKETPWEGILQSLEWWSGQGADRADLPAVVQGEGLGVLAGRISEILLKAAQDGPAIEDLAHEVNTSTEALHRAPEPAERIRELSRDARRGLRSLSAVLGLALLITSSLFLDDWSRVVSACEKQQVVTHEDCIDEIVFVTAAVLAILASLLQLVLVWPKFDLVGRFWMGSHALIFILVASALALQLFKESFYLKTTHVEGYETTGNSVNIILPGYTYSGPRALVFLAFTIADTIFIFVAVIVAWKHRHRS